METKEIVCNSKKHRFVDSKNWEEEYSEVLERLLDESDDPEHLTPIYEDQWSITRNEPHCPKDRSDPTAHGENPVHIFRNYIEMGLLPSPEILLVINSMFDTYFAYRGNRTLEDVFFGDLKRGVGNYAARWSAKNDGIYSAFNMWKVIHGRKYSSEYKRAEAYLIEWEDRIKRDGVDANLPDVDTFLRQHRRSHGRLIKSKTDN